MADIESGRLTRIWDFPESMCNTCTKERGLLTGMAARRVEGRGWIGGCHPGVSGLGIVINVASPQYGCYCPSLPRWRSRTAPRVLRDLATCWLFCGCCGQWLHMWLAQCRCWHRWWPGLCSALEVPSVLEKSMAEDEERRDEERFD